MIRILSKILIGDGNHRNIQPIPYKQNNMYSYSLIGGPFRSRLKKIFEHRNIPIQLPYVIIASEKNFPPSKGTTTRYATNKIPAPTRPIFRHTDTISQTVFLLVQNLFFDISGQSKSYNSCSYSAICVPSCRDATRPQ